MTTNHKRWVVWRDNTLANNWINPWVAAARDPSDYGYAGKFFPTHAEALAHADRMARTVEVTLPRVVDAIARIPNSPNPTEEETWYSHRRDGSCLLDAPYRRAGSFTVSKGEVEPLALALLALHYRNQP